ncbi:Bardet-Biedl syndrome 1 protein homolog [Bacillus rossius redtenbacheri]|uniref:Bardet-Biedl syndrome 1 protein homolog n=1 Tax=Bacillus rossius redtenbacheri TaxID=93214 RepID=UPI002FDD05B3
MEVLGGGIRTLSHQRWLDAFSDDRANIYTFSSCVALADLSADGDHRLVVADLGTGSADVKLKVYKGTCLVTELTLLEVPNSVAAFYMDLSEPRVPAIAVASGASVYIYKNLKPYFRFTLPSLEVNPFERDVWMEARDKKMSAEAVHEMLQNVRQEAGFSSLSSRSQRLLALDRSRWHDFVAQHRDAPLRKQTVVTCMTLLKKCAAEEPAVSCLVVGTESATIYILDSEAFTVLHTASLGAAPTHLQASGLYDVQFRLVAACRDGSLSLVRRGWGAAKVLARLCAPCVALELRPGDAAVLPALMTCALHCYSKKGRKLWEVALPAPVTAMVAVVLKHVATTLLCVALRGGAVHFYQDRQLVDSLTAPDTVSAVYFGRYGQEEHSLILVTMGGALLVKILKRTAQFVACDSSAAPLSAQQLNAVVPKKTKLFVEQAMRERECAAAMHQAFQQDLVALRLEAARACVQAVQSCSNPVSGSSVEPLKISAQVLGLGPMFKILLTLQNMSETTPSKNLSIVLHCDVKMYNIPEPYIQLPLLVPGLEYQFSASVECVSEAGLSDLVQVLVVREGHVRPLLAATIAMPACDLLALL